MRELIFKPELFSFDTFEAFVDEFQITGEDLIITNEFILEQYRARMDLKADVIYQERYGKGEPSDEMFEAMYADIAKMPEHRRIIGIGGGTVLDLSKIFALKFCHPVEDLFDRKLPVEKDKELILIPTTCGTGSEVTNISILAFVRRSTKFGLVAEELYADKAVLIPEFLKDLPFHFFATSSIDALIHAMESSLSPKATDYTRLFGYEAIRMILGGYQKIAAAGEKARFDLLKDFLTASNYAGLAFGTAGCGPVHALSYPLSGTFHVAHGEANYAMLDGVMKWYQSAGENPALEQLKSHMAGILGCEKKDTFERLEQLLNHVIQKKTLSQYGADDPMLQEWSESVMASQQRLLKNSPIPVSCEDILRIYRGVL